MVHKIWHASKSVTDWRTDRQPKSKMPPQLLWSWGHKNVDIKLQYTCAYLISKIWFADHKVAIRNDILKLFPDMGEIYMDIHFCLSSTIPRMPRLASNAFNSHERLIELSCDMTKPTKWVCTKRRLRSAWASTQSDQSLHCLHEESLGP